MKNSETKAAPNYPIGSVDNALRLLLRFREQKTIGVSVAAAALGVAPSTAHRLLAMLEYHDLVARDPATRQYTAGVGLMELGLSIVTDMDIRTQARPIMIQLNGELGETIHLVALRGADALFLDGVESDRAVRVGSRTGVVLPAHCVSGGKALLARHSEERLLQLYPRERLNGLTGDSVKTRSHLIKELAEVRERGYATNFGESESGLTAVGVAVLDRQGFPRAALVVAAPSARLPKSRVARTAEAARTAAEELGRTLA